MIHCMIDLVSSDSSAIGPDPIRIRIELSVNAFKNIKKKTISVDLYPFSEFQNMMVWFVKSP